MEGKYKIVYHAEGIPEPVIDIWGSYLLDAHNRMALITDEGDCYAKWNKEFEDTHPGYELKDPFDKVYIDFINERATSYVVPRLNKDFPLMIFSFGDEHQLVGHVKSLPPNKIDFTLQPVE